MICNHGSTTCMSLRSLSRRSMQIVRFGSTKGVSKISTKIGFIGDGNMSKAICQSMVKNGLLDFSQVYVSSPYQKNLDIWDKWRANVSTDNCHVAEMADLIFIAVKPQVLEDAIVKMCRNDRAEKVRNKLFVSVLAGVTLDALEKVLAPFKGSRVIRTLPNMPMLIGEGCTLYCPGKNVTPEDLTLLKKILDVTGLSEQVVERMMNPFGALTGCGPAFVYLMIEALSDGAVKMGVPRDMATKFAAQMVLGSAKTVLKTGMQMGQLKDQVCSAGGTTIYGMHALETSGVRGGIMNAIEASTKRGEEMSMAHKKN